MNYIRDVVAPDLAAAAAAAADRLAADGRHDIRIGDDGETICFTYPSAVEAPHHCVRSEVLLEFGGRNVIDPNEQHTITPDMAALTPDLDYPTATVTVPSPLRTFWEKATLSHVECHRRRLEKHPERLSRHWFDLTRLAAHEIGRAALADLELLEDVVRHKKVFFRAGYANYDLLKIRLHEAKGSADGGLHSPPARTREGHDVREVPGRRTLFSGKDEILGVAAAP